MNLDSLSIRDLLNLHQRILAELRSRSVLRTNNPPPGDVGEYLVQKARGGHLETNSKKSYDLLDKDGNSVQVKVRVMAKNNQKFSAFRSFDFDVAIFVVFDPEDFSVRWARELTSSEVKEISRENSYVNARELTGVRVLGVGIDITDEIKDVLEKI